MADNVLWFPGDTRLDIPPDRVLEGAAGQLDTVLIIGKRHDGSLYLAASTDSAGEMFVLIERCRLDLVQRI